LEKIKDGDVDGVRELSERINYRTLKRLAISADELGVKLDCMTDETYYWNAIHQSVFYNQLEVLKFFMEQAIISLRSYIKLTKSPYESVHDPIDMFVLEAAL